MLPSPQLLAPPVADCCHLPPHTQLEPAAPPCLLNSRPAHTLHSTALSRPSLSLSLVPCGPVALWSCMQAPYLVPHSSSKFRASAALPTSAVPSLPPSLPSHVQGWCFALPTFVFRVPYALLDASLWSLIIYWAVGFDNSVRYLMFWLLLVLVEVW